MEYFIITSAVVSGAIAPFVLWRLINTSFKMVDEWIKYSKNWRLYGKFMNPDHWFLREVNQCPNKDYINLKFENSASNGFVSIGVEKSKIRGFI